ncbi:MAG: DUF1990 domain-containing protein [Acidobacteriia bacterium]|nr:DUF1990 domain-containing protein [Terriglobia bacterium]
MFFLRRPSDARIRGILECQSQTGFSYPEVGATGTQAPRGYHVDHERFALGHGAPAFARAKSAIRVWEMFHNGWTHLCWPGAPIERGATVAMLVRALGLWSVNVCRIVYVIDEPHRYGFAYGTLPAHVEAGEERFLVEWLDDGSVWFDLLAFSRARHVLAKIASPLVRALQRRFRRDAGRAMRRAIAADS